MQGDYSEASSVPITTIALTFVLSAGAFAATQSKSVTFDKAVQVNGTTVPAGDYKVKYDDSSSNAQVSFLQGKKQVATASGQVKDLGKKANQTAVIVRTGNSVPALEEIDFGGSAKGLTFAAPATDANAGQ